MELKKIAFYSQNKKGFTLVELVVVIAILAVLAAIAIPSVFGIIYSANQSSKDTTAAEMSRACKDYYTGIISGQINQLTKGNSTQTNIPTQNAGLITVKNAANTASVQNALEYSGMYGKVKDLIKTGDNVFVYDSEGNIYSARNSEHSSLTNYVTADTTLGTLYK